MSSGLIALLEVDFISVGVLLLTLFSRVFRFGWLVPSYLLCCSFLSFLNS